jgi:hypothetical protein
MGSRRVGVRFPVDVPGTRSVRSSAIANRVDGKMKKQQGGKQTGRLAAALLEIEEEAAA